MKVTKAELKKIIKEEISNMMESASYRQHQGGWYGTGATSTSPAQSSTLSADDAIEIRSQISSALEEEGMDWILDDIVSNALLELGWNSNSVEDYKLKIKQYLNKNSDNFGYSNLGDAIVG